MSDEIKVAAIELAGDIAKSAQLPGSYPDLLIARLKLFSDVYQYIIETVNENQESKQNLLVQIKEHVPF